MHTRASRCLPRCLAALPVLLFALFASACTAQPESTSGPETAAAAAPEDDSDVGAASLRNELIPVGGHRVDDRVAFAAQPSEQELRALAEAGVRVLDLRRPEEERGFDQPALAAEIGLDYRNVPVDGPALGDPDVHAAFKEALEADGELVVHCASGNRVAGLYYAYLVTEQGMDRDEARARAKELGMTSAGVENGTDAYLDAVAAAKSE